MLADRAMWASVAIVDYLRNGVPLEDAPRNHVGRSLAALMNAFRLPLDEHWERLMQPADGANLMWLLSQEGYTGFGIPDDLLDNCEAISGALAARTWESLSTLPKSVWKLIRVATGMSREEWEELPEYCRGLLSAKMICPDCMHSATMDTFGEPNPIDDPTYFYQQRLSMVFRCPKCGTEITYAITAGKAREYHAQIFGTKTWVKWVIVGVFVGFILIVLLGHVISGTPRF